jgi:hypothetical protein
VVTSGPLRRAVFRASILLGAVAIFAGDDGRSGTVAVAPEPDLSEAVMRFVAADVSEDVDGYCSMLSEALLARLDGETGCVNALSRKPAPASLDRAARELLSLVAGIARDVATAHGRFPAPQDLVNRLRLEKPLLRFRLGTTPRAARAAARYAVVVDRGRSNAFEILLYAESDSATIWSLRARLSGPFIVSPAGRGVPGGYEEAVVRWHVVEFVDQGAGQGRAVVAVRQRNGVRLRNTITFVVENGAWKVSSVDLIAGGA